MSDIPEDFRKHLRESMRDNFRDWIIAELTRTAPTLHWTGEQMKAIVPMLVEAHGMGVDCMKDFVCEAIRLMDHHHVD